ncbi:histidine kinase [Actinoallomurus purpureus]|uniref:sensor histidine kinase n=1 Tax=Actinoallomurus purpureus TaxID=478114 RepID=UPI002092523A|nr:histidine kinase [Actinoallomurus purpureus]MCO6011709.1 histidine kinase [Actinoallomurus purpureus]
MNGAEITARWHAGAAALRRVTSPPPPLSRWAWAADAILALVLTVGTLSDALTPSDFNPVPVIGDDVPVPPIPPVPPPGIGSDQLVHGAASAWQLILAVLTALPLVARRRYPIAAFWAVIGATQIYHLSPGFDPSFTFTACLIAAYSAVMYSPYRALAMASVLVGAGLIAGNHEAAVPTLRPGLVTFLLLIPAGLTANAIHTWKQRVRTMEAEQDAATRRAVERERSRIAQELHDVVTHNVSMMVVQAGAARKVMRTAPERAEQALLAVESGGRSAMTELRHVMGLLTMNGDDPDQTATEDLAPPPGLDQVPALADRVRETGVPVELTVTGSPVPLPAGVDLAAYRVVQEALTNTVKHAAGARVMITVAYGPRALRVEVTDTGGTPAASARSGSGRGLIGLRERLAVYGGTLEAGELPADGYRVCAVIPVGEE